MGCSSSSSSTKALLSSIKSLIDSDNSYGLSLLLKQEILIHNASGLINSLRISHLHYKFSLLDYSLFTNKPKCFVTLLKTFKFCPISLVQSFHSQSLDPAIALCEMAALEILETFFPLYLEAFKAGLFKLKEKTPLEVACEQGHINIVSYLLNTHKKMASKLTDIQHINSSGLNMTAVALLAGKYSCFKFVAQKSNKIVGLGDPISECLEKSLLKTGNEYQECVVYLVQNLDYRVSQNHIDKTSNSSIFNQFLYKKFNEQCADKDSTSSVSTSLGSF